MAVLFTPQGRTLLVLTLKGDGVVKLIGIADQVGNVLQVHRRIAQELAGFTESVLNEELLRRDIKFFLKQATKILLIQITVLGHIINSNRFLIVALNKINGFSDVEFGNVVVSKLVLSIGGLNQRVHKKIKMGDDKGIVLVMTLNQ